MLRHKRYKIGSGSNCIARFLSAGRVAVIALILLFFAIDGQAQYTQVTHLTGTATYAGVPVTVTSSGIHGSGGGMCLTSPVPYNSGGASGGDYTFTLGVPVYSIKLICERIHTGEYVEVSVNGTFYPLTPANMLSYTDCSGLYFTSLSGGDLIGPTAGHHSEGTIEIKSCTGINSFKVYCNGGNGGSDFYAFINPIPGCLTPTNNGPLCLGDTLKLAAAGDSTGATYFWYGPDGFTSTLQYPVIPNPTLADSGIYHVVKTAGAGHDTATTDVVIKRLPIVTATSTGPVCSGNTLTLNATPDSTGETFTWTGPNGFSSALQNPAIASAVVIDSGTYKVVTAWNGCKDSATVHVAIDSTPATPAAGSNSPLCAGSDLMLTAAEATPGVNYSWAGPAAFSSVLQNPGIPGATTANAGTYTVTVKLGGCSSLATIAVTVNALPALPTVGSDAPLCSGGTLHLTSSSDAGATYSWSGPNSFSSVVQNPVITSVSTLASGVYSVTAVLGGCSSAMAMETIVVDATPVTPVAGSNSPICSGNTLMLTADNGTAGSVYNWAGPAGYTATDQNPNIVSAPATASGIYTVTVGTGICTASATVVVTVNLTPATPVTSSSSPVCAGSILTLNASSSAGSTYSWTGPNSFTSTDQNPVINPATTAHTGTYTVVASQGGVCFSLPAIIYAEVDTTPAAPVVSNNSPGPPIGPSICEGDTLKFFSTDATPGITYSWTGPGGFASTLQNPFIANATLALNGAYSLVVGLGACTVSATTTATVTPSPSLTATSNSPVCSDSTIKLAATSDAGALFSWTGPHGYSTTGGNPIIPDVTTEWSGVYQVTVLLNNCTNTANDTVIVHQTPGPPWMAWLTYCQYYGAPPLMAYGDNILWYTSADPTGPATSVPPIPNTDVLGSTFYYASQTVEGCISSIDSMQVTINPKPVVTVSGDSAVCPRDTVVLTATDLDAVANYFWYPSMYLNRTDQAVVVSSPETDMHYTVVASNQYGCSDTAHVAVTVYPNAVIYLGDSARIYPGEQYQISPQTNCVNFKWSPALGLTSAYISNPIATPEVNTKYIVTASTENGCVTKDSLDIYVSTESDLAVPNAFTPGSSANNVFRILKRGIAQLRYFRVYDRWGVMVFEATSIEEGWDGTYKGKPQPMGVYMYEIGATSSTGNNYMKKGNVTLLR